MEEIVRRNAKEGTFGRGGRRRRLFPLGGNPKPEAALEPRARCLAATLFIDRDDLILKRRNGLGKTAMETEKRMAWRFWSRSARARKLFRFERQPGTLEEFEEAAQAAWERLPRRFRDALDNVTFCVEDFADADTLRAMRIRDRYDLLGLYHGPACGRKACGFQPGCPTASSSTASRSSITPAAKANASTASSVMC